MPQFGRRLSASSTPAARRSAIAATRRSSAFCQERRPAEYRDGAQDPPDAAAAAPAEEDFKRPRAVSPSALSPGGPEVDDLVAAAAAAASKEPAAATVLAGPGGYLCSSTRLMMEKAAPAAREQDWQGVGSRGYVRARAPCFQPEERKERDVEDQITCRYENNKRFFGCGLTTAHCEEQQQQQQQSKGGAALLLRNNSSVSSTMSEPVDIPGARTTSSSVESGGGAAADEEGWVSLWNTYTRLFPGTFTGCSPPRSTPPLDSPLYAASPRAPPPPMDASPSRRNKASGTAGTPDVRGGGLLPAARASGGYPLPPATPESGSGSRLRTTATVRRRRRRLNQRRPSTAAVPTSPGGGGGDASLPGENDAAATVAATGGGCAKTDPGPSLPALSTPRPDGWFSCHQYQQPGEEEVVGHVDEMLLDDDDGDDDDEVLPRGYSWGRLSLMPLEEAGRKLGTFSAKGFSTGGGGGGGDGRGCLDVSVCQEGGGGCAAVNSEDDLDDNSDADLELSEGLMFDLEM
ncbi:unnamed protein product [Ectocarpus sp. CCAP 1310/34]|nr:unnamed protein product [Ectocarpus sp. CCAP 1310/34]